ncbi:MAG: hypothetical protein J5808_03765 [Paludibacteraceae bacterium]|nr:hypothetical protein [Paludibacteraceae bacterium]
MTKPNKSDIFHLIGAALVFIGAVIYLLHHLAAAICVGVGAVIIGYVRVSTRYQGDDLRLKRLSTMQTLTAVFYLATAILMYMGNSLWVICLLYAAVMELVLIWRTPRQS